MLFSENPGVIRSKFAPLFLLLATLMLTSCGEQDLTALSCGVVPLADAHEPDDSRTAAMLRPPLTDGIPANGTADSYFHRDVFELTTTGGDVTIDLTFNQIDGDLDMFLFDETGAALIASAETDTDNEQIALTGMETPDAGTYYLLIRLFGCPMTAPFPVYYQVEFNES